MYHQKCGTRLWPRLKGQWRYPLRLSDYSGFRLGEHTFFADFTPLPSPLPQGERGPENTLFIQMKTAIANPLFATLANSGKCTPAELAKQTGLDPGYVSRWCDAAFAFVTLKKPIANCKLPIWGEPSFQKRQAQ